MNDYNRKIESQRTTPRVATPNPTPRKRGRLRFRDLLDPGRGDTPLKGKPGRTGKPGRGAPTASRRRAPDPAPTRTIEGRGERQLQRQEGEELQQQDAGRDDRLRDAGVAQSQDETQLLAFSPPPAVLFAPTLALPAPTPVVAGSAAAQAETAAMAQRLLDTLRVGRTAGGGHQVRMRLAPGSRFAGVEVRLEEQGGELHAVLLAEPGADGRAAELAEEIVRELRERGVELESVELERA
ncbi:MAG: flagellar hook-length control protein FliK [Deltaproteobacteria bacterium]|nr:flagellar hook-length control protein FliK [Deltaproteobacteria bacterium]